MLKSPKFNNGEYGAINFAAHAALTLMAVKINIMAIYLTRSKNAIGVTRIVIYCVNVVTMTYHQGSVVG